MFYVIIEFEDGTTDRHGPFQTLAEARERKEALDDLGETHITTDQE